jgi:hypothetical protein
MATLNTLNKFGVPNLDQSRQGILQPKLKYRFRVITTGFGPVNNQTNFTQQVMNVTKPQITTDEVQIDSYNSRAWVAGKHTWGPTTIVLRDDISNSVSQLVGHQLQKQLNHFEQTAPAAGINYKFDMFYQIMDGGNDVVQEEWFLEGCWINEANYDSMDYSASEMQQISLTVRFDNATQSGNLFPVSNINFSNLSSDRQG